MHEPDFWTGHAEAMEQSINGERVIAQEIVFMAADLGRWIVNLLSGANFLYHRRQKLPPL